MGVSTTDLRFDKEVDHPLCLSLSLSLTHSLSLTLFVLFLSNLLCPPPRLLYFSPCLSMSSLFILFQYILITMIAVFFFSPSLQMSGLYHIVCGGHYRLEARYYKVSAHVTATDCCNNANRRF